MAMAAGPTDHRWTTSELLPYPVPLPAWRQQSRRERLPKQAQQIAGPVET
jgi:hypothetical protein